MIISADVKGLEVVCCCYLSQDQVLLDEILHKEDIHGNNQKAFNFGLGKEGRLVAKRFKFKMIYGGTAPGFAQDPDFRFMGWSMPKWQNAIDEYYNKYSGIKEWHSKLIDGILSTGFYDSPSGRVYDYRAILEKPDWFYIPKIKNWPVQGLGADIVEIARISLHRRHKQYNDIGKLINTVHDSIDIDTPADKVYNNISIVNSVFEDLPTNLSNLWNVNWNIPITVEFKNQLGEEIKYE